MSVLLFADSAWPLPASQIPAGVSGVCGYIGGDCPHVWTPAEWAAQKTRFRLPIYVRSNPPGPGAAVDVAAAVAQLRILGAPQGCLVAWDMETAVDPEYIGQVYEGLTAAGYKLIVYGSKDFVLGNKNPDGYYWGADWTNVPHVSAGNVMTQFVSFTNYDESAVSSSLPFWDTAPVAAPPVFAPVELTVSVVLPQLEAGADDRGLPHWFVRRLQAVLNGVYGAGLVVDGVFGPLSQDAVRAVQRRYALPVSGVVDQGTWEKVLGG